MEPVIICNDGIIKMLIESNYNKNSMIYEALNNCLPLNIIQNNIFKEFRIKKKNFPKNSKYYYHF